jgi:hypothetical protein
MTQRRANALLARIRPFDEWKADLQPTPEIEQLYHRIVSELQNLASGGPSRRCLRSRVKRSAPVSSR